MRRQSVSHWEESGHATSTRVWARKTDLGLYLAWIATAAGRSEGMDCNDSLTVRVDEMECRAMQMIK
jgi:hypothetical protein